MPGGASGIVVGFGPDLWERLAPGEAPASLVPMRAVESASGHVAPATQHDLWVWLHGARQDVLFDAARAVNRTLDGVADLAAEQVCFPYHNSLSTMGGFIDGTANPGPFEQARWAIIPDDQPGAGGSTVLLQRWTFTGFEAFNALPLEVQEHVFGHHKPDGSELDPQPADSHVGRTTLERDGDELKIVRRNAYWGTPAETGVMFVGFGANPSIVFEMLDAQYGVDDPATVDLLIDYASADSGSSSSSQRSRRSPRSASRHRRTSTNAADRAGARRCRRLGEHLGVLGRVGGDLGAGANQQLDRRR